MEPCRYNHVAPAEVSHEYIDAGLKRGTVSLRAVSRSEGFDWYLDGKHVLTTIDEEHNRGKIGLFVEGGAARFSRFSLTELTQEHH